MGILILAWLYGAGLIYVVFICVSMHFANRCFLPAYKMFHQLHAKDRHSDSRNMYHVLSSWLHALTKIAMPFFLNVFHCVVICRIVFFFKSFLLHVCSDVRNVLLVSELAYVK